VRGANLKEAGTLRKTGKQLTLATSPLWLPTVSWPAELVTECELLGKGMVARGRVCLYVPNRDRIARIISLLEIVPALRSRIRQITGGQTTYRGSGDYVSPAGIVMDEDTAVLETFLPKVLTDSIRDRLTRLFVWFGYTTNQEEVQVAVRDLAYRLPTGMLLDAERKAAGRSKEGTLLVG